MRNFVRAWFFLACGLMAHTSVASTTVLITNSNHDNTIFTAGDFSLGGGVGTFVGTDANGSSGDKRGLVSFDIIDNVPAGSIIQSVTFTLTLAQVAGSGMTMMGGDATPREIDLHKVTASWGEGTAGAGQPITSDGMGFVASDGDATWTSRFYSVTTPTNWTTPGGDYASTVSGLQTVGNPHNNSTAFTWTGAQMAADVQSWRNSGDTNNFGWILINTNETDLKTFRAFWTREAASTQSTAAFVPTLSVTYVPEPATGTLLLVGSIGLVAVAWRRQGWRLGPLA